MKVLLINSPTTHAAVTSFEWMTTAEDIGAFPPIGLMYLAGMTKARSHHDVRIVDMVMEHMDVATVGKIVAEYMPDVVGLTAFTPIFFDVMEVVCEVKKVKKDCHVCLGGAHVSAFPVETIAKPEIDSLLLGESEYQFLALLDALEKKKDLRTVPGIVVREENGSVFQARKPGYIEDINELPFPAFELLPFKQYHSGIGTGNPVGTICSSRGCPHECTFCCKPYRTYRMRKPDNIIAEMRQYYARGIREFFFFDDMFNLTPKRVIDISSAILNSGMKIIWSFRGRVDQVSEEMFDLAKRSGCQQVLFGVETATDAGLKEIRKGITTAQVLNAVHAARRMGLETSTNWIIGFPHDRNASDVENLIEFARKVNSDYAQFNILIPYSGTPIFEEGVRRGVIDPDFWRNHTVNPAPNALIPIWDEHMSREELSKLLRKCYRRFYFRFDKVVWNLTKIKNFSHLFNKVKGVSVLLGQGGYKRREFHTCT